MSSRLVQWNGIELYLDCRRLTVEAQRQAAAANAPVSDLRVVCAPDELTIRGRVHKFVTVPFQISIRWIEVIAARRIRIHLDHASAFGIPLPTLLVGLAEKKMPDLVAWDASTHSLVVDLDRILPPFVDVEVADVRLASGAVVIILGAGGADLPDFKGEALNGAGVV